MTTVTIESIKAEQSKLAEMIARLEAQTKITARLPLTVTLPDLREGERWVGAIISADGKKRENLILLPGDITVPSWDEGMAWAASIGGELPDRVESALAYATMKDEFKPEAYWTRAQHASYSDYAWCQGFDYGYQDTSGKGFELRARTFRRSIIL